MDSCSQTALKHTFIGNWFSCAYAMVGEYPDDWSSKRREVYKRDNYTCQNCGRKGGPEGNHELHAHHIVPINDGGTHSINNLKTLCNNCHKAIHHDNVVAPTAERSDSEMNDGRSVHFAIVSVVVAAPLALIASWLFSTGFTEALVGIAIAILVIIVIVTKGGKLTLSEALAPKIEFDDPDPDYWEPPDEFFGTSELRSALPQALPMPVKDSAYKDLKLEFIHLDNDDLNKLSELENDESQSVNKRLNQGQAIYDDAQSFYYEKVSEIAWDSYTRATEIRFKNSEEKFIDAKVRRAVGSDMTVIIEDRSGGGEVVKITDATAVSQSISIVEIRRKGSETERMVGIIQGISDNTEKSSDTDVESLFQLEPDRIIGPPKGVK